MIAVLFPLAVGLIAGVLGALLGLGGGVVVVPALELLGPRFLGRELPIQEAVAASQVGVLSVAVASSAGYLGRGLVRVRTAYLLSPFTVFGGIVGSVLGLLLDPQVVALVFAALLAYTGVELLRGLNKFEVERTEFSPWARPGAGFAGIMSGLLGIGGGTVQVPVLNLLAGLPFRAAIATSTFMMGLTAIGTTLIYGASGRLDLGLAAPVALGILVGARAGTLFAARVPASALRLLFAALVFYTAVNMALDNWPG